MQEVTAREGLYLAKDLREMVEVRKRYQDTRLVLLGVRAHAHQRRKARQIGVSRAARAIT